MSAGATTYVTGTTAGQGISYTPHGAMAQYKLGSQLYETWSYNSRLQADGLNLGTTAGDGSQLALAMDYSSTGNNGNLLTKTITGSGLSQAVVQS